MGAHKVLVVGGGGREHSLCLALNDSVMVDQLYCCLLYTSDAADE